MVVHVMVACYWLVINSWLVTDDIEEIGEHLILLAVEEVLKTVPHKSPFNILIRIPLSNSNVQRHNDEMSSDIENYVIICKQLIFLLNWTSQPYPIMKHYYWYMLYLLWTKKFKKSYYSRKI